MGGSGNGVVSLERALTVADNLTATAGALLDQAAAIRQAIARHQFSAQPKAMYDVPEAATYMGIGERTLRRMIADDEIESIKIGARRLVPRHVIDAYLKAKAEAAAS
ncbi:MAG TPA: helix-turn-helix domain-containing protein [Pilimelia sp.]|nr:helix-turn-helix domain-containing protein [Pilimelia sp.]